MASDAKERIRARLDIAELIGETVALKPAGRGRFKGLCPFHAERTPSFHVHQERGFFYCFGCHAKGDLFDFVMQSQGVEFPEALQLLGHRAGVEVTPDAPRASRRRDLFDVNRMALAFFRERLEGPPLEYLRGRKLSDETIEAFQLGYAPDAWDALLKHALTLGYRDEDLMAAGLLAENDRGRRYDRFRNRVIFPILDRLGRPVGFAGRVLDDSLPKYLNTPETELFDKGHLLYGLDRAKNAIRERGECLVVEGYMDVIALHQVGITHAVAALGTTLTEDQAQELSRLDVRQLLLAFDADAAGQRAVLAGLDRSVGRRFLVRAVRLPAGKDPADAVLDGDVEAFTEALRHGLSEVEFRFRSVLEAHDPDSWDGKRAILEDLLPALRPRDVFDPVAAEMRRLVIDELEVDGERLDAWVNAQRRRGLDATQLKGMSRGRARPDQLTGIELEVVALLLLEPSRLGERLSEVEAALPPDLEAERLRAFRELCAREGGDDRRIVAALAEWEHGAPVLERLMQHGSEAEEGDEAARIDVDRHLEACLSRLRELALDAAKEGQRSRLEERMEALRRELADPALPRERLDRAYHELRELQALLAARDAERRLRLPVGPGRGRRR